MLCVLCPLNLINGPMNFDLLWPAVMHCVYSRLITFYIKDMIILETS